MAKATESDTAMESQRSSVFVQIKEEHEGEGESEESRQKAARRENRLVRDDLANVHPSYYVE